MAPDFMTNTEIRLEQLACLQRLEEMINALDVRRFSASDLDTLKAKAAEMRDYVERALIDGDGQDRN